MPPPGPGAEERSPWIASGGLVLLATALLVAPAFQPLPDSPLLGANPTWQSPAWDAVAQLRWPWTPSEAPAQPRPFLTQRLITPRDGDPAGTLRAQSGLGTAQDPAPQLAGPAATGPTGALNRPARDERPSGGVAAAADELWFPLEGQSPAPAPPSAEVQGNASRKAPPKAAAKRRPDAFAQAQASLARTCPALAAAWAPPSGGVARVNAPYNRSQEPEFGQAKAKGAAFARTTVGARTCFELLALDQAGNPLDQGPLQRAYFQILLTMANRTKGLPAVRLAADVQYLPASSTHRVCYTPLVAGAYRLVVYLVFENAWRVAAYLSQANKAGYAWHRVVGEAEVTVEGAADAQLEGSAEEANTTEDSTKGARSSMPACSFELLRESGNGGSWAGQQWLPNVCNNARMDTEDVLKFLDGKRIAFVGDSEIRYTFNILRRWLRFDSTEAFVKAAEPFPMFQNSIVLPPAQRLNVFPFNLRTCQATSWHTSFENGQFTYYGTFWTGFAHYMVSRPSHVHENVTYSFNVTYIAQLGADEPLGQAWMANDSFTAGATVPDEKGPYDLVFATLGLHDVSHFHNATAFAATFRESYLPAMRKLVRSPDSVVFFGMWSAYELQKPADYIYCSNNVRALAFETAERQVLAEEGFSNFISTRLMTMARPDLCLDSTHYSWPVTFAMLNLAFRSMNAGTDHGT